jgi:hypothetical protein
MEPHNNPHSALLIAAVSSGEIRTLPSQVTVSRQYHGVWAVQGGRGYLTKLNASAVEIRNPSELPFSHREGH